MYENKGYIKDNITFFPLLKIEEIFNKIEKLKVLVIGDTIIDEYCFVIPKGRAIKDPILSVEYINHEEYAGGIIAIANHISGFVRETKIVTLIGENENKLNVISNSSAKNIELKTFIKRNAPTTLKKRFVDSYRNNKLFKVEYMNDAPISKELTEEIIRYLEEEISNYDLVVVGDFGHGFINDEIRRVVEANAKFLAVNAQSNSANMGYNFFTNYKRADFRTMDETELRLPVGKRFEDLDEVIKEVAERFNLHNFLVTRGRKGCIYSKNNNIFRAPILIEKVKDTIGAGDAVFAITSLLAYLNVDEKLVPFVANCAGGIASNIMGNKESINKEILLKFIYELYKEHEELEIKQYLTTISNTLEDLDKSKVATFVKQLLEVYNQEKTIYVFGNGGSGATASHFCGDLVKGVSYGLEKRFKAICLNDNMPAMMSIANDISYDDIFIEQLKNFMQKGDLVVGISGSGNSVNVVKALEYAKEKGVKTAAICGYKGGKIKEIADISIHVEVPDMEVSEDIHNLIMIHCVKRVLTNELENKQVGGEYEKRVN